MLKILNAEQIREADAVTISNEPVLSIDLMERAAAKCTVWLVDNFSSKYSFIIFCGHGNNGGDGLAIARQLYNKGKKVKVYFLTGNNFSADFIENKNRLNAIDAGLLTEIKSENDFPQVSENQIWIDALLGTGVNRKIEGLPASLIQHINKNKCTVVSIDVPSGLYSDKPSVEKQPIIKANYTLTFQLPKLSFLFPSGGQYSGKVVMLDIGLNEQHLKQVTCKKFLIEEQDIKGLIAKRDIFSHKGVFGHALLITGSYGKTGAAVLSTMACLRSGAGLVTAYVPKSGYQIMQSSIPEAMTLTDPSENHITELPLLTNYSTVGIGPGIGKEMQTVNVLKQLIQNCSVPFVLDADALNIMAENKTWISFLPAECILTPHVREFERLAGKSSNDFEQHQLQLNFSMKYNCYVVLKGHYTCITGPNGESYFNSTGNAGMATGGAGDVLTGIITGLLAQGYRPLHATLIGVYLHGLAGDLAVQKTGMESLIASDIVNHIGKAYLHLQ